MPNTLLAVLPEYLPMGVIMYDKDGCLKYANQVALDMFGVTMEDFSHINIFNDPNITDEDKAQLKKGLDVSFETDYDFELCTDFYKTGIRGIRKYFVTKVTIMRDSEGGLLGYVLTCEEITERKAQERRLTESYKKVESAQTELALALNTGKLVSWQYRVGEGKFFKFDANFENIETRTFDEIFESTHPDDRARFAVLLDAIVGKKKPDDDSIVLRVNNFGETKYRYSSFMYSATEDEAGNVTVVTFIERDITDEVEYQQYLISAKEKAEEADKLKSTFLANMSHEIRTPLNAIVGFSALLSDADDAEEKNEYRQLIETNSEILLKLIGDILDLSKIEVGSIDINRQPLDLSLLCDELFRSFEQRMKNSEVKLRLINPYSRCIAKFDKHRFIQIFTNFVSNAIKYTPKGEIVMGYECAPGRVRMYVRDTGIGIPEEKKHRIFGRFEKLDNFAQGTGLGLSICKAIADATGGEVGFESTVHEGSEFWYIGYTDVEYTEKSDASEIEPEHQLDVAESNLSQIEIHNLNILVAEDNDSNYLLLKNILKENRITRALTGVEVVEKALKQHFDVIFMDIRMPVMDGLRATARIRQFNPSIPIVALTADAFDSDREAALAAGCDYFMAKPIKKRELIELLSKLC